MAEKNKNSQENVSEINLLKEKIRQLQNKLDEQESLPPLSQRLINYFKNVPLAIQLYDDSGNPLYCNSAYYDLAGQEDEDPIGMNLLVGDSDFSNKFKIAYHKALSGNSTRIEPAHTSFNKDRKPIWVLSSVYPVYQDEKQIKFVVLTIDDIARGREIDIGFSEETKRILMALENSGDGIWEYKPKSKEVIYNNRMFTMLGYSPNDLPHTYTTFSQLIHPEDAKKHKREVRGILYRPKNNYDLELRFKRKDGTFNWVLFRGMAVEWDSDGEVTRIIGTQTDIHSIKEVEEKYQAQRLRNEMTLAAANDGTWDWNVETDEVFFDDRYYTLAGYEPGEFPRILDEYRKRVHPDDHHIVFDGSADHIAGKEEFFSTEFRYLRKDNSYMWILSRSKIFEYSDDGSAKRIVGIHTDITNLKNIEASLQKSNDELSKAKIYLERQNRFQEALLDAIPNPVFYKDMTGNYIGCNDSFSKIMNVSKQDIVGKSIEEIWPYEDASHYQQKDDEIYKTMKRQEYEYSLKVGNQNIDLIVNKDFFYDENGNHAGVVGIAQNISELKASQRKLAQNEQLYRLVTENSADVIWTLDIELNQTYVSPSVFQVLGYTVEEYNEVELNDFLLPVDVKKYETILEKWKRDEASRKSFNFNDEMIHIRKDGVKIWIEVNIHSLFNEKNEIIGLIGTTREITLRKNLEDERRKLKEYLDNMVDSMPSIIIGIDKNHKITHWNAEASRISGLNVNDIMGQPLELVLDIFSALESDINYSLKTGSLVEKSRIPYKTENFNILVDLTIYPLRSKDSEGAVIRLDDVTERAKIDQMMVQSEKMMSVGGLAAGMAHEINNPLAGILQNIQVINNRLSTSLPKNVEVAEKFNIDLKNLELYMQERDINEMMDGIIDSGKRASQIVNNMLSFSRKSESRYSSHDVNQLLDSTLDLAANDYDLKKKYDFRQIKIEKDYESNIPPIPCEASKLQQVFFNLIKNSSEAMSDNRNRNLESRLKIETKTDGDILNIQISDNGTGMDETTLKRVFEPFFTTKEVGVGTGLGLSVSYFIITEDHGGEMSAESNLGIGSKFTIQLPYKKEKRSSRW